MTSDFHIREKRPKAAFNEIKDQVLPSLRKNLKYGEIDKYESKFRELCVDFRILLERTVEKVLLNDVVARFRRSVKTMGQINALSKIQLCDCSLLDDLMTRYSCFVHSQSEELPVHLPSLDDLEGDLKSVIDWITEFEKRPVT